MIRKAYLPTTTLINFDHEDLLEVVFYVQGGCHTSVHETHINVLVPTDLTLNLVCAIKSLLKSLLEGKLFVSYAVTPPFSVAI
jgi:hypothetical protein